MKRLVLLLAVLAATPAAAQSYDPQADADRTRAELRAWGAQADVQAANAAAYEAESQATLRRIEAARARPAPRPDAYDPLTVSLMADQQAAFADRRAADMAMRDLDARLAEMDAFLASAARPKP